MNHYLAKLRELELAVNQNEGFVSFVSPLTGPKSEKGKPTEPESVTGEGLSVLSVPRVAQIPNFKIQKALPT
jgi:hypothetical protein